MESSTLQPAPSLLEKALVNLFTPGELAIGGIVRIAQIATLGRLHFGSLDNEYAALAKGEESLFTRRVTAYEKLLSLLEDGNYSVNTVAGPYMRHFSGRIAVHLARNRGLVNEEQHRELASKYHIDWGHKKPQSSKNFYLFNGKIPLDY